MLRSEELVDVSSPRLLEAESVQATPTETTVLTVPGHATACDIWFKVPAAWESLVTLRLYGRVVDARVLLKTVFLGDAHRTLAGGVLSGIALSVRGRPVTAFEITAQSSSGSATGGVIMAQVWSANDTPSIVGGATSAAQQAAEERTVAHVALRNGTTPILATADSSGRVLIAGAGSSGSPVGGVVSVQGPGSAGALTVQGPASGVLTVQGPSSGTLTVQGPGAGGVISNKAVRGNGAMYSLVSPSTVRPSFTTAGTVTWLMTLRSVSKKVEIQRIIATYSGQSAAAAADGRLIIARSPTNRTGGVSQTVQKFDTADSSPVSLGFVPGGATTLALTGALDLISISLRGDAKDTFIYDADGWGKPLVLASSGETLGIRHIVDQNVSGQSFSLHLTVTFIEI